MTIESATYISDLNSSYPEAGTAVADGDDHVRLIKSTVKASFPNITGAVTATHTELNVVDGASAGTVAASKAVIYSAAGGVIGTLFGTTEYDAGNSGTSKTIDFANGQNQKLTLTGNVSITLSNPVAGQTSKLRIVQGASAYTVTFSTTVKWPGGTAYTASSTNGDIDIVTLYYDGSTWYGQAAKDFS